MSTTQIELKEMTKEEYIKSWSRDRISILTPIDTEYGVTQKDVTEYFKGLRVNSVLIPLHHSWIFDYQFDEIQLNEKEVTDILGHSINYMVWDKMVGLGGFNDDLRDFCESLSVDWWNEKFNEYEVDDYTPPFEDLDEKVQIKVEVFIEFILINKVIKYLYEISVDDLIEEYEMKIEKLEEMN